MLKAVFTNVMVQSSQIYTNDNGSQNLSIRVSFPQKVGEETGYRSELISIMSRNSERLAALANLLQKGAPVSRIEVPIFRKVTKNPETGYWDSDEKVRFSGILGFDAEVEVFNPGFINRAYEYFAEYTGATRTESTPTFVENEERPQILAEDSLPF